MLDLIRKSPGHPIRVLIVDDQAVVRHGLRLVLLAFDDLILVGAAESGEKALELCAQTQPDVVLMDLLLPGMDAASTTGAIRRVYPHTKVIVMSSFWAQDLVQEALDAGATSHLLKNVSAEDLASAIRTTNAGA